MVFDSGDVGTSSRRTNDKSSDPSSKLTDGLARRHRQAVPIFVGSDDRSSRRISQPFYNEYFGATPRIGRRMNDALDP
jgi:hypothetical protein